MASLLVIGFRLMTTVASVAYGVTFEASSTGTSLSFLVVGDWGRKGLFNQSAVATQMGTVAGQLGTKFVISDGDNFYDDGLTGVTDPAFTQSFTDIYTSPSLQVPWYLILGNHDYRGDALSQLSPTLKTRDSRWNCLKSFTLKYRLCSPGSTPGTCPLLMHIFFVDTTPFVQKYWTDPGDNTYDWRGVTPREVYMQEQVMELEKSLNGSDATWKIVVGHHPIRSVGEHGDTAELLNTILPVLKTYNVSTYINGHDHCLEHIRSIDSKLRFLTSGGGSKAYRGIDPNAEMSGLEMYYDGQGFMSMDINATSLTTKFYAIDGIVLHQFSLSK